ncbi:hypothetical protein BH10ACT1_BH10ACT1_39860 [soil metagenome]
MIDWLFRNRETGRYTVVQFPNVALATWLAALAVRRLTTPEGTAGGVVGGIATIALAVWAIDEIVRGVNPWRRFLGAIVLATTVAGLLLRS